MSWGAAIGGIAQGIAGIFGAKTGQQMTGEQHDWSVQDARDQRAWMEKMSNSAHEREVADLRRAGLNPILSAGGGGAQAGAAPLPDLGSGDGPDLGKVVSSALETAMTESQTKVSEKLAEQYATAAKVNEATERKINKEASILSPKATLMERANDFIRNSAATVDKVIKKGAPGINQDLKQYKNSLEQKGKP